MLVSTSRSFLLSLLGLLSGLSLSSPAIAQLGAPVKVGDRVEVQNIHDKWLPGVVTEVNLRHQRATVMLDKPDRSEGFIARLPKESIDFHRRERADFDEIRLIQDGSSPVEKPRKWTDKAGRFSVLATFGGIEEGKVILKKSNGQTVKVPLDKLATEDAKYATDANDAIDPFAGGESSGGADTNSKGYNADGSQGGWPSTKAKLRGVITLRPKSFKEWSYEPNSVSIPKATEPSEPAVLTPIEGSNQFFEDITTFRVAGNGSRAIVSREEGKVGSEKERYVELIDLASGQSAGLTALPPVTEVLDVLPEEGLVMFRPDFFGSGKNRTLYLGKIEGDKLTPVTSWNPYEKADWDPSKDIKAAWFLSSDRVMTINDHGKSLTIWETATAKAVLNVPISSSYGVEMAISPNRELLAIVMKKGIALIDLIAGLHVATLSTQEEESYGKVSIRADHQRLAATSRSGLTIWDLNTGKQVGRLAHPLISSHSSLLWTNQYPLIADRYLFDPDRRILLWEYSLSRAEASDYRGGRLWFVPRIEKGGAILLGSAEVPHGEATTLASSLGSPDELLAVKPGDPVKIEVDVDRGIASSEEVRKAIEENARKAGLTVADDASLVISAICKRQERQTIKINTGSQRFRPDPGKIVSKTITPHASFLEMKLDGQTLFKRGYIAKPGMTIWLNEGETLDQALNRITKPNIDMLKNARIPGELGRPGSATDNGAYGASTLTVDGVGGASVGARFE